MALVSDETVAFNFPLVKHGQFFEHKTQLSRLFANFDH